MSAMSSTADEPASLDEYSDPRDFYTSFASEQSLGASSLAFPSIGLLTPPASATGQNFSEPRSRSADRSPTRRHRRRGSSPSKLQNTRSIPPRSSSNLPPASRNNQKNIKDLVSRFNQDAGHGERPLVPPTLKDKHKKGEEQRAARLMKPRSPIKTRHPAKPQGGDSGNLRPTMHKLDTSGTLHQSVSHDGFLLSASPKSPVKRKLHQPAYGEVAYNANRAEDLGYGIPAAHHTRRGSDGSILKGTVQIFHTESPQDPLSFSQYTAQSSGSECSFKHSRSHSDQSYLRHDSHQWATSPYLEHKLFPNPQMVDMAAVSDMQVAKPVVLPAQSPSQPHSRQDFQATPERKARTPASKYHRSSRNTPTSQTSKSPSARRYDPRRPESPSKLMKAYITAPSPQKSPPLRSSRPRQPVAQATTAASRARVAERFAKQDKSPQEEPIRSKQRRKIPELGRVDFAERRARIERALSQNLDDKSDFDGRSSRASSRRRSSAGSIFDKTSDNVDEDHRKSIIVPTLDQVVENPLSPIDDEAHRHAFDSIADHTMGDTDFEEDETADGTIAEPAQCSTEQSGGANGDSIQATPIEFTPRSDDVDPRAIFSEAINFFHGPSHETSEDNTHNTSENPQAPIGDANRTVSEAVQEGIDAKSDFRGNTLDLHHSKIGQPAALESASDPDEDAALYRPRTPVKSPLLNLAADDSDVTPRQLGSSHGTIPTAFGSPAQRGETSETFMQRVIREFEESGRVDPLLLHELERRGLASGDSVNTANSDVATIQVLLDRFTFHPPAHNPTESLNILPPVKYEGNVQRSSFASSYSHDGANDTSPGPSRSSYAGRHDTDDPTNVEANPSQVYLRPQSGQASDRNITAEATGIGRDLTPASRDEGHSSRSSARYSTGVPSLETGPPSPSPPSSTLKRVSDYSFSLPEIEIGVSLDTGLGLNIGSPVGESPATLPPQLPPPAFPPPAPPVTSIRALSGQGENVDSSRLVRSDSEPSSPQSYFIPGKSSLANTSSLRPSQESQRADSASVPPSQLSSTFSQLSLDASSTAHSSPTPMEEQGPSDAQRRIQKRRNVIKELVDTEYSYHRDIKIIEDIYKATCGGILSTDDKKILFGNADQIEALSLDFYDAVRKAVSPFYVVQKSARWQTKRASVTTSSSSDKDSAGVPEISNEETDKQTAVGAVFEEFLPRMEKVYGTYLKNHEAANKRLVALQNDESVKWWLKACHQNASDITSAWDLDSLLVKPVQRFLKYPLLLQQLLVITPSDHPDHGALQKAVEESTNISHRMNEAKKRADLVESIVNRKRKDSELRAGLAKAFGIRSEKVKERIGMKSDYQDPAFDELSMKFGGHYIRLQVVMRDVQGSLTEVDAAVGRFNALAQALEQYMEIDGKAYPDVENRWRNYIVAIRELASVALTEHKEQVQKRVIDPMITALKLHEGPQNAMAKRKKRVVDYVRCQQLEKAGQKPDKKTLEGSELYVALNEQLKIDLPKLYELSAELIRRCLMCHHQIQLAWLWTWEMKLRPILGDNHFPASFDHILPQFHEDFDLVNTQVYSLALCNGSALADAAHFISPQISQTDEGFRLSRSRAGTSSRTHSIGSEQSVALYPYDLPRGHSHNSLGFETPAASYGRSRASSQISVSRGRATSVGPNGQPPPRLPSQTPASFSGSRPQTASRPNELSYTPSYNFPYNRSSAEVMPKRSPRPESGTSSFSIHHEQPQHSTPSRYSNGMYSSAMPMSDGLIPSTASTPNLYASNAASMPVAHHQAQPPHAPQPSSPKYAPSGVPVLWVAVSVFQFNIDSTRREGGYPYLVYNQGEVFDVVASKGELWLAKNQDDPEGMLGWIWEQHFVVLEKEVSGYPGGRTLTDEELRV